MGLLDRIGQWPGRHAGLAIERTAGGTIEVATWGPVDEAFALASVSKVAASLAVLVEVAAARCSLDDDAGPPGASLAHLLSHASGLPLDGMTPVAAPGARRIYSNTGIDLAVAHASARAGMNPSDLLAANVFTPLAMEETVLGGRPSSAVTGPVRELGALAAELLVPTLVPRALAVQQRAVAFPGLVGVLPGFGRHDPCDWGLGVEVKGVKRPHWTGPSWPDVTFGHFGQAGGFVAVDPEAGLALVTLGDEPFGPWAVAAWPTFTDDVRAEWTGARAARSTVSAN